MVQTLISRRATALACYFFCLTISCNATGCRRGSNNLPSGSISNDTFIIIDTRTDGFDLNKAKSQAQDAIAAYPKLNCMVGLFAYNPPLILEAVRDANKLDQIQIVAFDEDAVTLQAIIDGEIYGTVVQNPYQYGYQSVRVLAGLARGDTSVLPEGGFLNIPAQQIKRDNARAYRDDLESLLSGQTQATQDSSLPTDRPTVAFVTNGRASFWDVAEKGAIAAGIDFSVNVVIKMPSSGVDDQNRMIQTLLANKIDGIAISPIDPDNQEEILAEASQRTILITHDSDAPNSDRLCYIGMDNYSAGKMCGQLIKEALPDGGSIMLFVGRLGQSNARLRRQGIIDELMDVTE
jgi:ribose transport system substrate-binding protein